MKHREFTPVPRKLSNKKAMCLARRVRTRSPSRKGTLLPWLQWDCVFVYLLYQAPIYGCNCAKRGEKKKEKNPPPPPNPTRPLPFWKVSVSTGRYYESTVHRLVDSKANSSGPLNKSVPKYNASTSIFSPDTWQFNLKSNWSCLWTSAYTVWGGWTIYWFRLIFVRSMRDRLGIRCHALYILRYSKT